MWAWLAFWVLLALATPAWGQNAVLVEWDDHSANEDGFKVERGTALAGPFTEIASVGANVTSYFDLDAALVAGTLYCYRTRAFNGFGNSAYTNAKCDVPGAKEKLRFKVTPAP